MPAINGLAKPASPRCGRRSKTGEAKSQTDPLNSRIDGLLATVSLGAGYRRINRLPATPSIGVASHEFLLRACFRVGRLGIQRILESHGYELAGRDVIDAYRLVIAAADKLR